MCLCTNVFECLSIYLSAFLSFECEQVSCEPCICRHIYTLYPHEKSVLHTDLNKRKDFKLHVSNNNNNGKKDDKDKNGWVHELYKL